MQKSELPQDSPDFPLGALLYCTFSVITDECVVAPDVAVTVTLNEPAGVPVTVGGGFGLPPQETANASVKPRSIIPAQRKLRRRRDGTPKKTIPRKPKPVTAARVEPLKGCAEAVLRAVVAMESVVLTELPLGVKVAGLKLQLDWPGSPVQAKLIVPLKPPCGVMEMV
jgi:hypothetical protein